MNNVFKAEINDIFNGNVKTYHENRVGKVITFDLDAYDMTFDDLTKLSKLLKTKKINVSKSTEVLGGCDTCGYGSSGGEIPITAWDVTFPE
jgi:hypothetical protein